MSLPSLLSCAAIPQFVSPPIVDRCSDSYQFGVIIGSAILVHITL